jgi:hypothetical protein
MEDRVSRFLTACLEFWDVFDAEGKRYGNNEYTIWSHHSMFANLVKGAMQIQGLPTDIFDQRRYSPDARISKEDLTKLVATAQKGVSLICHK